MIDYTNSTLEAAAVHSVGNKTNDQELILSKSLLDISSEKIRELLFRYFLSPFTNPEFYTFTFSNEDYKLNPLYIFASQIFENTERLHENSVNVAKHLYELSIHPQIKSGDLFVVYFSNLLIGGETTDAIGLFKSENRQAFLKLDNTTEDFSLQSEDGINVDKLDKGCLILNTGKESGYKVCIIDKSNKAAEAQYWKDNFLQLKPCSDEYHQTKEFMNIAKNFVTKRLTEDFDVSRADQIDLLNRSVTYFKNNETFDKKGFEDEVFQNKEVINAFHNYDEVYRDDNDIDIADSFDISPQAVKKQTRVFKSVLKLDRNFHIYIHGDKELIEQGVEKDGRKFYKIYFENEA